MTKLTINKPVDVTAVLFTDKFEAMPRRIEFEGKTLTFLKNNIKKTLDDQAHLFDLINGNETYRVQQAERAWTLLEILKA